MVERISSKHFDVFLKCQNTINIQSNSVLAAYCFVLCVTSFVWISSKHKKSRNKWMNENVWRRSDSVKEVRCFQLFYNGHYNRGALHTSQILCLLWKWFYFLYFCHHVQKQKDVTKSAFWKIILITFFTNSCLVQFFWNILTENLVDNHLPVTWWFSVCLAGFTGC